MVIKNKRRDEKQRQNQDTTLDTLEIGLHYRVYTYVYHDGADAGVHAAVVWLATVLGRVGDWAVC